MRAADSSEDCEQSQREHEAVKKEHQLERGARRVTGATADDVVADKRLENKRRTAKSSQTATIRCIHQ
jgi:hypothetical protein